MSVRRILCFGDSNTWGASPLGERYDETVRWPRVMARLLGPEYDVIEEGLNGRTTVHDDPTEGGYKSGLAYLPPCLMSHSPLDLVIIMLGTNDTKRRFNMNAYGIAQGVMQLVQLVHIYAGGPCGIGTRTLIVAPPIIGDNIADTTMGPIFGANAHDVSKGLAEEYRKIALLMDEEYLSAGDFCGPSRLDAVHFTRESQLALAEGIANKVKSIFGKA